MESLSTATEELAREARRATELEDAMGDLEQERAVLQERLEQERRAREDDDRERTAAIARDVTEPSRPEVHEEVQPREVEERDRIVNLAEVTESPRVETRVDASQLAREKTLPPATGKILLRVLVGPDGTVEETQVLSSFREAYSEVAAEAVKSWIFTPARVGDQPVRVWIRVPVMFR